MIEHQQFGLLNAITFTCDVPERTIILFHGYGSNEKDLFSLRSDLLKNANYICFRAPIALPWGGYAWFSLEQHGNGEISFNDDEMRASVVKVSNAMLAVSQSHLLKGDVIIGGFSQGVTMAQIEAVLTPSKYRGLLFLSGRYPDKLNELNADLSKMNHWKIFIGHGINDTVLPIGNGRKLNTEWQKTPAEVEYHEYEMEHSIHPIEIRHINEWMDKL